LIGCCKLHVLSWPLPQLLLKNQPLKKTRDVLINVKSQSIKQTASKFLQRVQSTWSRSIFNSNLAYVIHLEEKERTRRLNSDEEAVAIINSLLVAKLIKDLTVEEDLHLPNGPNGLYTFKLLEERERAARIAYVRLHGRKSTYLVAGLINNHFQKTNMPIELKPVYEKVEIIIPPLLPEPMQIFEETRKTSEHPSVESKPVEVIAVRSSIAAM